MKYKILFLLLFSINSFAQKSQTWWTPGEYLKFGVIEKGIYEIPLESIKKSVKQQDKNVNINDFRLFKMGIQVPVLIKNNSIIFYAEPNDGKADSSLYFPVSTQPHQFTSLFSDTAFYYLKNDAQLPQKLIAEIDQVQANLPILNFHFQKDLKLFNNEWTFNSRPGPLPSLESPYLEEGEIFTSKMIQKDSLALQSFILADFDETSGINPIFNYQLNGRDFTEHQVVFKIGSNLENLKKIDSATFIGFSAIKKGFEFPSSLIKNNQVLITANSKSIFNFDRYSFNYHELVYPQKLKNSINKTYYFRNKNDAQITFKSSDENELGFIIKNTGEVVKSNWVNSNYFIPGSESEKQFFVGVPKLIKSISSVEFKSFENLKANYLIITTPTFNEAANGFAKYRASEIGGNYQTEIINIRQLYDQFSFGIRSPLAMRNFFKKLAQDDSKTRFVLLIGAGRSIFDTKFLANPELRDPVPTFGFPGSDNLLSANINGNSPFLPVYPTGRISTISNKDALAYLEKVISHEANSDESLWRKQILHLSGGRSTFELQNFKGILDSFIPAVNQGNFGGKVETISKKTIDPVEKLDISSQVNAGVGLITFFGHSNPSGADIDIGLASDPKRGYTNSTKLPIIFMNGCGLGNTFFGATPLTTNWLLTPKKGAVLVLSHSYSGYVTPLSVFMNEFYKIFNDEKYINLPFGLIHQETLKKYLSANKDNYNTVNATLMNIQGDPAIKFFPFEKSDYRIQNKQVFIQSGSFKSIAKSDSVQIGIFVDNLGKYIKNEILPITINVQGGVEATYLFKTKAVAFQDTLLFSIKKPSAQSYKISVSLDNSNEIKELNELNNQAVLQITESELKDNTIFPNSIIPDKTSPILLIQQNEETLLNNQIVTIGSEINLTLQDDQLLKNDKSNISMQIQDCKTCEFAEFNKDEHTWFYENERILRVSMKNIFKKEGDYSILFQGFDAATNKSYTSPYRLNLQVVKIPEKNEITFFPNPATLFLKTKVSLNKAQEIAFQILDLKGNIIQQTSKKIKEGSTQLTMDLAQSNYSNGVYIAQIIGDEGILQSQKIVIIK